MLNRLIAGAVLIPVAGVLWYYFHTTVQTVNFTESNEAVVNPYSGAYVQRGTPADERADLVRYLEEHPWVHVWFIALDLRDYVNTETLPAAKLTELEDSLRLAEELGVTAFFRAAYDFWGQYTEPELYTILGHIKQIAPVLNGHKDILLGVQAGMIGPFGEWHSSVYMDRPEDRNRVLSAWLEELDPAISVSLRRQEFIRSAARQGIDTSRLGIYNDGLFASDTDLGTYQGEYDREGDLAWSAENIQVPFNGGEMPNVSGLSNIANVVREAGLLNLSYLNQDYSAAVWADWDSQTWEGMPGGDYLKKYLGSRLFAKELTVKKSRRTGLSFDMTLGNDGFAMVDRTLRAYFVLEHDGQRWVQEADLSMTGKTAGKITGSVPFSTVGVWFASRGEEEGDLRVGVKLCRAPELPSSYCIRLANREILDEDFSEGVNWLGTVKI